MQTAPNQPNGTGPSRTRRAIETAVTLGVVVMLVVLGLQLFQLRRAMTTEIRFGQPNLQDQPMVVPGRPHDVAAYLADPESIRRRVRYTWSTDAWGFRGEGVAQAKPAGGFRVAVVGECVAFGNGVNDQEPWPAQLEALLARALPDRPVEVINASSPDPPLTVLARLDVVVPDFEPDLVLLSPGSELAFLDEAQRASYPAGLAPERIEHYLEPVERGLERAFATCRQHGVQPVLVTPTFNSFGLPATSAWVERFRSLGEAHGVPVLDTSALLRAAERREGLVFERGDGVQRVLSAPEGASRLLLELPYEGDRFVAPQVYAWLDDNPEIGLRTMIDENHPDPRGHQLFAEAAFALLAERGLLPR